MSENGDERLKLRPLRDLMVEELTGLYDRLEAKSMVEGLFYYLAGISRTDFVTERDRQLPLKLYHRLMVGLEELKREKPLQYVTGRAEFMGLTLEVDEHVLIPRPETEELVQWVLEDLTEGSAPDILDVGTGSGCIALSLKDHLPQSHVFGMDISPEAIRVAERNARNLMLEVAFFIGDVFQEDQAGQPMPFDIIVSNPPYVTESEASLIRKNVKGYEPAGALFVPDHDPLRYYRALAGMSMNRLKRAGILYVEINEGFGKECGELFLGAGSRDVAVKKDMAARDRMVRAVGRR
jgi:release factor glutamine methyltransferase